MPSVNTRGAGSQESAGRESAIIRPGSNATWMHSAAAEFASKARTTTLEPPASHLPLVRVIVGIRNLSGSACGAPIDGSASIQGFVKYFKSGGG